MAFDDFNYDAYNKHILIDENFDSPEDKLRAQEEGFHPPRLDTIDQPPNPLTEANIKKTNLEQFEFEEIDTRTEQEIEKSEMDKRFENHQKDPEEFDEDQSKAKTEED
jgi:hypothetical protein|tara:strand:+ start:273 stop:596 length:324 start_codon:yes stop_codon:yes gene_type:complete